MYTTSSLSFFLVHPTKRASMHTVVTEGASRSLWHIKNGNKALLKSVTPAIFSLVCVARVPVTRMKGFSAFLSPVIGTRAKKGKQTKQNVLTEHRKSRPCYS